MLFADGQRRTQPPALVAGVAPGTFSVRDWLVFQPGYHKGRLFTREDNAKTAANFNRFSTGENPWIRPKAKLGHDTEQRAAKSLGLPNVGTITKCVFDNETGGLRIDVDGIPASALVQDQDGNVVSFDLKGAFDQGNINDGSVELAFDAEHPDDPSNTIDGPLLEAVAFLGEEQPAVKGCPQPTATFSARHQLDPRNSWTRTNPSGRRTRVYRLTFSEVSPMPTREEILNQLKAAGVDVGDPVLAGKTDDELFGLLKVMTNPDFEGSLKKKYSAPPEGTGQVAPPDDKTKASSDPNYQARPIPGLPLTLTGQIAGVSADPASYSTGVQTDPATGQDYKAKFANPDPMDSDAGGPMDFKSLCSAFAQMSKRMGAMEKFAAEIHELWPVELVLRESTRPAPA